MPETCSPYSRIPVLGAFEAVQNRTEFPVARLFVLFERSGFAGQFCDTSGEARAAPGGEDAPAEEPVGAFEVPVLFAAIQEIFQQGVKRFCFVEGEV